MHLESYLKAKRQKFLVQKYSQQGCNHAQQLTKMTQFNFDFTKAINNLGRE